RPDNPDLDSPSDGGTARNGSGASGRCERTNRRPSHGGTALMQGPVVWSDVAWLVAISIAAWFTMIALARRDFTVEALRLFVPLLFGVWLIVSWQLVVVGFNVVPILLPPPTQVAYQLTTQAATLWDDFRQTFLKAALAGFAIGCLLGFVVA